eukprot:381638_1
MNVQMIHIPQTLLIHLKPEQCQSFHSEKYCITIMKTVITLLTSLVMNNINCKTVDQSSTGALLSFPSVIDGPLFNKTYVVSPAQFGYTHYGSKLEAILVL